VISPPYGNELRRLSAGGNTDAADALTELAEEAAEE
jgi:hypothetical protein